MLYNIIANNVIIVHIILIIIKQLKTHGNLWKKCTLLYDYVTECSSKGVQQTENETNSEKHFTSK